MTSSEDTAKPSADKPTYAYDGLDRRDWKCVNGTGDQCSGGTRTEYGYIGLTELVSSASRIGGGGTSFNYDYDSQGHRLGQDRVPSSGAHTFHSYFTDPNGTVIGLENADGAIPDGHTDTPGIYADRAIYDFDPYGQEEDSEGSLSQDAQDNPYRFEGFELDSGVQTYDMQARPYRPDLGRFITPDRFEDSLGDFALQSDPLTQNRYAFDAGNPVNDVEFDGHCGSASSTTLYGPCRALPGTPKKTAEKVNRSADAAGRHIDQRNETANREAQHAEQVSTNYASQVNEQYCNHGEFCSRQDEKQNIERVRDALILGTDLRDVRLHRSYTEDASSPWLDLTWVTLPAAGGIVKLGAVGFAALFSEGAAEGGASTVARACTTFCRGVGKVRQGFGKVFRFGRGGAGKVAGSGPTRGVLELSSRMKSSAAVRNWAGRDAVEFVFDPKTERFAMGRGAGAGSPHEQLARAIDADESSVVGGMIRRDASGRLVTNEQSGHFWQNWNPAIRSQFDRFMRDQGVRVEHGE